MEGPPSFFPLCYVTPWQTVWQRPPPAFDPLAFITKDEYIMFFGRVFRVMNHPKNEELERRRLNARLGRRQAPLRKAGPTSFQLDAGTRAGLEVCAWGGHDGVVDWCVHGVDMMEWLIGVCMGWT